MADQHSSQGSTSGGSMHETVELNIKTLDSQIYSFSVDKNMPVSAFKEKISNQIGVPVGQQRLIFRGKVLKDEHLLSEYQVENGHTLHLVARQPSQPQSSSDARSGDANGSNINRGGDANAGAPRNRIGQISHSVVLGTLNIGDQGEGIVPDLTRVIGAVLNSFGVGGQTAASSVSGMQSSSSTNVTGQAPQGNETSGPLDNDGQSQAGSQTVPGQAFPGQSFQIRSQAAQIPLTAALPIPSLQSPIPDALSTMCEFIMRMEQALAQNGYQPNTSSRIAENPPRVELPSNARGLPMPEALATVLRRAEQLLSGHTISALSHIAGRLEQEGSSADPDLRSQIQTESVQVGLAMQHLGALLLELGRTILTLRMGQSPAESSVNAGPAVYISPSGPNPIMAQPFPLQTNSLFGGSVSPSNPTSFSPVGFGNASRQINIHIHAGTSLAPVASNMGTRGTTGDGMLGEPSNATGSGGSGSERVVPLRNLIAAALPSRSTGVGATNTAPPGLGISSSHPQSDSVSLPSFWDEMSSHLRSVSGRPEENQPASGSVGFAAPDGIPSSASGNSRGESQHASGSARYGAPDDMSSVVNGIISQLRSLSGNSQGESQPVPDSFGSDEHNDESVEQPTTVVNGAVDSVAPSLQVMPESEGQKINDSSNNLSSSKDASSCLPECSIGETSLKPEDILEKAPSSSDKHDGSEGSNAVPLGLGLGGLERKRRINQQPKSLVRNADSGTRNTAPEQNQNTEISGQQLLQSLASRSSGTNRVGPSDNLSRQTPHSLGQARGSDGQIDIAGAVSQVLQTPALDNLLAGFSEQTGVGSPNVLRNMMQQLTQNPQIMNTVSQMAQHVDGQEIGNMFSSLGSAQGGGGIDLSRMIQQMMPVVSQVLGGGSATTRFPNVDPELQREYNERRSSGAEKPNDQVDLQDVAQRIENFDAPEDVFNAVVENAVRLNASGSDPESILHELSNNEDLASDYMEMLRRDVCRRLNGDSRMDNY